MDTACKGCNVSLGSDNWAESRKWKNVRICKKCDNARRALYRSKNTEKSRASYSKADALRRGRYSDHNEIAKTYIQKNKENHPEKEIVRIAKHRAKIKEIPFTISYRDISIPDVCPVLKIPLIRGGGKNNTSSPSLDRIIPELGYIPGNVAVISYRANMLKNNATLDELTALVDWLRGKIT